ncbi:MAG: glycoside hydrolase family 88 protein [Planctomycetes bacterium]|nr:glycoside hydrolase family 88 protein [Planctomycetota bacterium]
MAILPTLAWGDERTPRQVAEELVAAYAQDIPDLKYTSTVALIGRLAYGRETSDSQHAKGVRAILLPYLDGSKPVNSEKLSASDLAGHLVFAALYGSLSDDPKLQDSARRLILAAADRACDAQGQPRPNIHSQMSDATFMACPLLSIAGALSGDSKYFQQALRYAQLVKKLDLRDDGLYRHSPKCEAAWGRGNAFPLLGLVHTLHVYPDKEPGRDELAKMFQDHAAALLKHQDADGAWHQVIDHPESYAELTCTCMIASSYLKAIEDGLLARDKYAPAVRQAWQAALTRIGPQGNLRDVCEGTGSQTSLQAYFDRKALSGRDRRGGSMALMFAVGMMHFPEQK